jgi:hypothetical protein
VPRRSRARLAPLAWIAAAGLLGFTTSFVFADVLALPVDAYYLVYCAAVCALLALYVRLTRLPVRRWLGRRAGWALAAGVAVGLVMVQTVLARPATARFAGPMLAWALLWRGLVYGAVDGLLLSAFPWTVVWRALGAEDKTWPARVGIAGLAWAGILFVTTAYHLGYRDFRSDKILQANVGNAIMSVPTLLTANPAASVVSHAFLHVAAVAHSPRTDLFLPPHRPSSDEQPGARNRCAGAPRASRSGGRLRLDSRGRGARNTCSLNR